MSGEICITTGARLHFGLLSGGHRRPDDPETGRLFGGTGLMIDAPSFTLAVRRAETDAVTGSDASRRRGRQFFEMYRNRCPPDRQPPPCEIAVRAGIPAHVGLGSGTQLGMAVAQALALLAGEDTVSAETLSCRVKRGWRSALGIHGFRHGGFLIDAGKCHTDDVGALAARAEFPNDWRIVLVTPPGESGLSGEAEQDAFARLPPMPQSVTDRLTHLALEQMLPAVRNADFETTASALYEFGRTVGEHFAPVQGGIYANRSMARLVEELRARGIHGIGQSSWGPTLFILMPDASTAEQLAADLSRDSRWQNCRCLVARPMNTGALIKHDEGIRA